MISIKDDEAVIRFDKKFLPFLLDGLREYNSALMETVSLEENVEFDELIFGQGVPTSISQEAGVFLYHLTNAMQNMQGT